MKQLLAIIFIFFFFVHVNGVKAQTNIFFDPSKYIPGIGCGVAQGDNGSDRCCTPQKVSCDAILSNDVIKFILNDLVGGIVGKIPVIGGLARLLPDQCNDAMSKINSFQQNVNSPCIVGKPSTDPNSPACTCIGDNTGTASAQLATMCYKYLKTNELGSCLNCAGQGNIWTGIGCVPLSFSSFLNGYLIPTGIGLGGIIALICIIYSAFMMQTSEGNPEKIKKAQENLTSCILGLMLIIFSVFILRLIGVDIIRIPFLMK